MPSKTSLQMFILKNKLCKKCAQTQMYQHTFFVNLQVLFFVGCMVGGSVCLVCRSCHTVCLLRNVASTSLELRLRSVLLVSSKAEN